MVKDDTRNLSYEKDCKYSMRKYVELPIPMDEEKATAESSPLADEGRTGPGRRAGSGPMRAHQAAGTKGVQHQA